LPDWGEDRNASVWWPEGKNVRVAYDTPMGMKGRLDSSFTEKKPGGWGDTGEKKGKT